MLFVEIYREKEANSLQTHVHSVKFSLGYEADVEKGFYLIQQHLLQSEKFYLPDLSCPYLLQLFLSISS